ncbi:MAG: DUF2846 domain-containing protein [Sulfurimonas sp.]|nr:DUF2846 domain-containing protein [Sulfurimonas sp.]
MQYILLILLLLLSGCSTKWESSASVSTKGNSAGILNAMVPKDSSYIYVYRESAFRGMATAWPMKMNNKEIAKLKNGAYFLVKTNPGKKSLIPASTVFSIEDKAFDFNAKAGSAYFLKHGSSSVFSSVVTLFPEDSDMVRKKLASYDLINIYEDYDPSVGRSTIATSQKCSNQSQDPICFTTIEEIHGKVIINRGNDGFRAKPGMRLSAGDNIITNEAATLYFLQYGEPKMIKPNSTYKVPPRS